MTAPSDQRGAKRRGMAVLYLAFAGLGATASSIPASLPQLAETVGASLAVVPSALFGGLLIGVLTSRLLLRRFPTTMVMALGSGAQAVGIAGVLFFASAPLVIASAALAGVGFGLSEAAGSMAVKQRSLDSAVIPLTALTATVAVVAAILPLAIAAATPVALGAVLVLHLLTAVFRSRPAEWWSFSTPCGSVVLV